jgi:hypothetical protein
VQEERPTSADLLEAWRETTRATELAERLANQDLVVADEADIDATSAERIATLAETAAESAARVAASAREAALAARDRATQRRDASETADRLVRESKADEGHALHRYTTQPGDGDQRPAEPVVDELRS